MKSVGNGLVCGIVTMTLLFVEGKANAIDVDENGTQQSMPVAGEEGKQSDAELLKKLNNPASALMSVPFQSNFEFNLGPNDDDSNIP